MYVGKEKTVSSISTKRKIFSDNLICYGEYGICALLKFIPNNSFLWFCIKGICTYLIHQMHHPILNLRIMIFLGDFFFSFLFVYSRFLFENQNRKKCRLTFFKNVYLHLFENESNINFCEHFVDLRLGVSSDLNS